MTFNTNKPDIGANCFRTTTDCIALVDELDFLEQSKVGYEVDQYMLDLFNRNIFDPNDIWRHIVTELRR